MKTKFAIPFFELVFFAGVAVSQALPPAGQAPSTLVGVWRGQGVVQQSAVPLIALTLTEEGGSLSGAILLTVIHLEQGKPVTIEPGIPEPVLKPSFDGQTLTFQMKYRGPLPRGVSSVDPMITYRLKLTSQNKDGLAMGDLVADAEAVTGSPLPLGPPIQMVRNAN